jgi:hypothetical protein
MCTITIDPNSISSVATSATTATVTFSGTATGCSNNNVTAAVQCGGISNQGVVQFWTPTFWSAQVSVNCPCGSPAAILVTCNETPPCTATYSTTLVCGCCPQVSTTVNHGLWNSAGQQSVTFVTTLTFPQGCIVKVQRDFGDGTFGAQQTFTSSPATYVETHAYGPGGYASNLNILSNSSCGPSTTQLTTSGGGAPPCATSSFWANVCLVVPLLFLVSAGAAGLLLFASLSSPACVGLNSALPGIAAGFAIAAGVFLLVLYLLCRKCQCGFPWKLLGQLITIVGAVSFIFVFVPDCMVGLPATAFFLTPFYALGFALVVLIIGAAGVLSSWYQTQYIVCPLTICDYWRALRDALFIAIPVAVIVAIALVITLLSLVYDLLIIVILIALCYLEIITNQNAGKC